MNTLRIDEKSAVYINDQKITKENADILATLYPEQAMAMTMACNQIEIAVRIASVCDNGTKIKIAQHFGGEIATQIALSSSKETAVLIASSLDPKDAYRLALDADPWTAVRIAAISDNETAVQIAKHHDNQIVPIELGKKYSNIALEIAQSHSVSDVAVEIALARNDYVSIEIAEYFGQETAVKIAVKLGGEIAVQIAEKLGGPIAIDIAEKLGGDTAVKIALALSTPSDIEIAKEIAQVVNSLRAILIAVKLVEKYQRQSPAIEIAKVCPYDAALAIAKYFSGKTAVMIAKEYGNDMLSLEVAAMDINLAIDILRKMPHLVSEIKPHYGVHIKTFHAVCRQVKKQSATDK